LQSPLIETSVSTELKQSLALNKNHITQIEQPRTLARNTSSTAIVTRQSTSQLPSKAIQSTDKGSSTKTHWGLELARQLADIGQVEKAINHCQEYLAGNFTNFEAYTLLGTLYQAKNENAQAERYFQKALYLNPTCYEALIHLSLLKEHRGDFVGAEILKQRVQKIQQNTQLCG
jgi:chemotaxis protein methyltransferase WspC